MAHQAAAPHHAVPRLVALAVAQVARSWHPARPLTRVPPEVAKAIWAELKAHHSRRGTPMSCSDMYPFVRYVWCVELLDLSDSGKWITDASLQALSYVATLRSLRLTACRFVTDDGVAPLAQLRLDTLDVSWTQVGDAGVAAIARIASLTSLNLTGLAGLTDRGVGSLIQLTALRRLALACTGISDVALDYLTYYTRYPDPATGSRGLAGMRWLELSNTRLTDTGVGKLVAIHEDGKPYGKVFKELEYLALSMTSSVGPSAVRQVRVKYAFDTPLPNAQRTLAKSNAVALEAQSWVIRFMPTKDRQLPAPSCTWDQSRVVNYIAQYTKERAAADAAAPSSGPAEKRPRLAQ